MRKKFFYLISLSFLFSTIIFSSETNYKINFSTTYPIEYRKNLFEKYKKKIEIIKKIENLYKNTTSNTYEMATLLNSKNKISYNNYNNNSIIEEIRQIFPTNTKELYDLVGICRSENGNFYLAGNGKNQTGDYTSVVIKLDNNGKKIWESNYIDNHFLEVTGIDIDNAENLYISLHT